MLYVVTLFAGGVVAWTHVVEAEDEHGARREALYAMEAGLGNFPRGKRVAAGDIEIEVEGISRDANPLLTALRKASKKAD